MSGRAGRARGTRRGDCPRAEAGRCGGDGAEVRADTPESVAAKAYRDRKHGAYPPLILRGGYCRRREETREAPCACW